MPRSAAQSDFVVGPAPDAPPEIELPEAARPVSLPKAIWRTSYASARATKWVMGITFATLLVLLILTMVGPHIPAGE